MNPKFSRANIQKLEVITLGGGCFWCTEAVFRGVKGVVKVEPGYAGGSTDKPTYQQVATGRTGHAEVVQITFNSDIISVSEILQIFFATHDPTTPNRQGADVGSQYRSVIFFHNDEQRKSAEKLIEELDKAKIWNAPIITEINPLKAFYNAEKYHVNYYANNKKQQYCRIVIEPKIQILRKRFKDNLKIP